MTDRGEYRVLLEVGRLAHPIYREQMHACPSGFLYVPSHPDLSDVDAPKRDVEAAGRMVQRRRTQATAAAVQVLGRTGVVLRRGIDDRNVELVHSGQFLLRGRRPYVVDFEDGHVFTLYQRGALERPWARRRLANLLTDERCRAALPWTNAARRGLLTSLGSAATPSVSARVQTVLPAIRPRASRPRTRRAGPLRIVFVGTSFFGKGAVEAVRALEAVRASHDVELDLVTLVPSGWRSRLDAVKGLRVHERLAPPQVNALYARADAMLFPAHVDTLGWVVFEAQAEALPVLASDHHSLPETVGDGESGLLFPHENSLFGANGVPRVRWLDPSSLPREFARALEAPSRRYVDEIATRIARLAEDAALLERLSAGALERVTSGVLSVERRRETLGRIYRAALSSASDPAHIRHRCHPR